MNENVQLYIERKPLYWVSNTHLVKVLEDGTTFCGYAPKLLGKLFESQADCISAIGEDSWQYIEDEDLIKL